MEDHVGSSQRAVVMAAAAGLTTSIGTGNPNAGLNVWYLSMIVIRTAGRGSGTLATISRTSPGRQTRSRLDWTGRNGRIPGPDLPELCDKRGPPGGVCSHWGQGAPWTVGCALCRCPCDDPVYRSLSEVRLCRADIGVCPGRDPQVRSDGGGTIADDSGPVSLGIARPFLRKYGCGKRSRSFCHRFFPIFSDR